MSNKVYELVTETLISQLEQGTVPWRRPWNVQANRNLISKKSYRGINALLLSTSPYSSPWWVTYRQAMELGGHVRRGEHSTLVVFWKWIEKRPEAVEGDTDATSDKAFPVLRYYQVFNIEQCEGIPADAIPSGDAPRIEPLEAAEAIVREMPARPIISPDGGERAYYSPATDSVHMPKREMFESVEAYYGVLFHELTHATGHWSRLKRFDTLPDFQPFGTREYSREELVAEMGAAFLSAEAGIDTRLPQNAAYIASWLKALRDDKRMVVLAAAQAQKAADFILNRKASGDEGREQ